jgi:hypothetical protein
MIDHPEGIIVTISQRYLKERGNKAWLEDFMNAMNNESYTYWLRLGNRPKWEVLYIYLIIGNRIRYRYGFVMYEEGGSFNTSDGRLIFANCWLVGIGPLTKANEVIHRRGFQGFRYTGFIF